MTTIPRYFITSYLTWQKLWAAFSTSAVEYSLNPKAVPDINEAQQV